MYLGSYHFDGDPETLMTAYERVLASFAASQFTLQICVAHDGGITVFDTCPSRADFDAFSSSVELHEAIRAAGMPEPRIEREGEIRTRIGSTFA